MDAGTIATLIAIAALVIGNVMTILQLSAMRRHLAAHDESLAAQRRSLDAHSGHLKVHDESLAEVHAQLTTATSA